MMYHHYSRSYRPVSKTFPNHEVTMEETAAASLDTILKKNQVPSSNSFTTFYQVHIRLFTAVLQQMARADLMTALPSPAVGVFGLKSNVPGLLTAHNFRVLRNSFLSPDSAGGDPAATLAQQRAKLKASHAAHHISAPALATAVGADGRNTQEMSISTSNSIISSRPKSTCFSGVANAFKTPSGTPAGLVPSMDLAVTMAGAACGPDMNPSSSLSPCSTSLCVLQKVYPVHAPTLKASPWPQPSTATYLMLRASPPPPMQAMRKTCGGTAPCFDNFVFPVGDHGDAILAPSVHSGTLNICLRRRGSSQQLQYLEWPHMNMPKDPRACSG
ncbi:Protein VTS1 [Grifola frondosa]|uniref:Protein VTS1 n=1 Tax=Grifola frondosa TaxID=5627 RepID=A0A1C7M9H0_GRIFR|nr:Protein VTS1 [Grifola frondosa]